MAIAQSQFEFMRYNTMLFSEMVSQPGSNSHAVSDSVPMPTQLPGRIQQARVTLQVAQSNKKPGRHFEPADLLQYCQHDQSDYRSTAYVTFHLLTLIIIGELIYLLTISIHSQCKGVQSKPGQAAAPPALRHCFSRNMEL